MGVTPILDFYSFKISLTHHSTRFTLYYYPSIAFSVSFICFIQGGPGLGAWGALGAGYKTLLLAVYNISLFSWGSEVAGYKTSLYFRSSQVAVNKTLLFSQGPNLQKVFFQIWLSIRPIFIFARHLTRGFGNIG